MIGRLRGPKVRACTEFATRRVDRLRRLAVNGPRSRSSSTDVGDVPLPDRDGERKTVVWLNGVTGEFGASFLVMAASLLLSAAMLTMLLHTRARVAARRLARRRTESVGPISSSL